MKRRHGGGALVVGLVLLSVITLLGLAGATAARVEMQLAHDQRFRENASSAASAGIEFAISHMTGTAGDSDFTLNASLPGQEAAAHFAVRARLMGHEYGLPQAPGANLAGAHYEILSTGYSARGASDAQRAIVMRVVPAPTFATAADCEPAAPVPCLVANELVRLSWQRLP
jgi:Tfp pilus assembly protein PilX